MTDPVCRRCFQVEPEDNVATLLEDAGTDDLIVFAAGLLRTIRAHQSIGLGHKVALTPIQQGSAIVKYGVTIGLSTTEIQPGAWVHLHNCRSKVDERSNTFDVNTGVLEQKSHE